VFLGLCCFLLLPPLATKELLSPVVPAEEEGLETAVTAVEADEDGEV
jgi:hypothetical protein